MLVPLSVFYPLVCLDWRISAKTILNKRDCPGTFCGRVYRVIFAVDARNSVCLQYLWYRLSLRVICELGTLIRESERWFANELEMDLSLITCRS